MNTDLYGLPDSGSRLIEEFSVRDFKSIRSASLELRSINILIGANGAGKSNLVQALRAYVAAVDDRLEAFSAPFGARTFFTDRNEKYNSIEIAAQFVEAPDAVLSLGFELVANYEQDVLRRRGERLVMDQSNPLWENGNTSGALRSLLTNRITFQHLADTSETARIKEHGEIDDNRNLHIDGSNLAAFLYLIFQLDPLVFSNIEATIRRVFPFFGRFELAPAESNPDRIRLWWSEKNSNIRYSPHSLSDGTLRFMALTALLMQPRKRFPRLIVLDEPELGLHPDAVQLLASMISAASHDAQIIVCTQSVALVNQFEPQDIITVERRDNGSVFSRLNLDELEPWLAEFSLGELWEKNVLGAQP